MSFNDFHQNALEIVRSNTNKEPYIMNQKLPRRSLSEHENRSHFPLRR